jgi:hypothetical protein
MPERYPAVAAALDDGRWTRAAEKALEAALDISSGGAGRALA